jgi:hypothetical protein
LGNKDLKSSSERVGKLCPILVDHQGRIIDGAHRFKVNENWPTLRLDHIKTDKDRLIARIVSNVVRRTVSQREKIGLLGRLGQICLSEGTEPGKIAHEIAEETGMSYRWVVKYLPLKFKDGFQSNRANLAAHRAAGLLNEFLRPPRRKGALLIKNYVNTEFVTLVLEKNFYEEFERDSLELGMPTEFSILKALEDYQIKMNRAVALRNREKQTENRDFCITEASN